jgi:NAD(P)H-dependent FMN reductase
MAATIIGISGSLRRASFNSSLLRAAAELAPDSLKVEIASIRDIPLYDGDVEETQGVPAAVAELKDRIASSSGVLVATPEYNASIPGVMKNALDWLTRPGSDIPRVFGGKPFGLIGATPGPGGTRLSQTAWLPILRVLNVRPFFGRSVFAAAAGNSFGPVGALLDDKLRDVIRAYMSGLAAFIGGH